MSAKRRKPRKRRRKAPTDAGDLSVGEGRTEAPRGRRGEPSVGVGATGGDGETVGVGATGDGGADPALASAGVGPTGGGDEVSSGDGPHLAPGALIGDNLQVEEEIGFGGMGRVYRARDGSTGETVAVKVLATSPFDGSEVLERFQLEAETMMELDHPAIVRVIDADADPGRGFVWIEMELVGGCSLREWLEERWAAGGEVDAAVAVEVAWRVAQGLEAAHRILVHRDLKPENVMLPGKRPGDPLELSFGGLELKIIDFGVAKVHAAAPLTAEGVALGAAYYMAPEQRKDAASVDGRADLYSLAVMLYEMLTGTLPEGRFELPSEARPELPEQLDAVVLRGLESKPARRYGSAEALLAALAPIRAELRLARGLPATDPEAADADASRVRVAWLPTLATWAGILVAGAGAAALVQSGHEGWGYFLGFCAFCMLVLIPRFVAGACPLCRERCTVFAMQWQEALIVRCDECRRYSVAEEGRLTPVRPGYVAPVPSFRTPFPSPRPSEWAWPWAGRCAVCQAPATRTEKLSVRQPTGRSTMVSTEIETLTLEIPHCAEHKAGVRIHDETRTGGGEVRRYLSLEFRAYDSWLAFREANGSPL